MEATARCAVHPGRPAHDLCTTCRSPRCAVDGEANSGGCRVCAAGTPAATGAPVTAASPMSPSVAARTTRGVRSLRPVPAALALAACGASIMCVVGAAVGQEYVGAQYFSWLFPGLIGLACSSAAVRLAGPLRARPALALRLMAGGYGAVSALLDFRFTQLAFGPVGRWLPPVLAAIVGGVVLRPHELDPVKRASRRGPASAARARRTSGPRRSR